MDRQESIEQASKGYIKDYYSQSNMLARQKKTGFGSLPNFDRKKALDAIRKDSTVQAAITTLVDKTIENGWKFSSKDNKSNLKSFEETAKKVNFDYTLRSALYQIYGYQNAFIEIVKDGNNNTKELHVLETTQTEPVVDIHGTILGYIQNIPLSGTAQQIGSEIPDWGVDEITHIKVNTITNSPWSDFDIERIYTSVLIKQYIYAYIGWLFGSNQFRNFYKIKDASSDQVDSFIAYLKSAENNLEKPLIAEGEIENQVLRDFSDGDNILNWVEKCDRNIYELLQVPPVAAGETGQSNRSSADKQDQMLSTRIKSIQSLIKTFFNNDLFPKMGFPKISIEFNPILRNDISNLLENAERMKIMGFKIDKIEEYLEKEGFPINGGLFDKEMINLAKQEMKQNTESKSEDMYPSRRRKRSDETSKEIGTGEDSTTRDEQIAQGYMPQNWSLIKKRTFGSYPYTME